jgi:kinesin family protein 20
MIVNVNPYDTGFDENAHVMRFSAIAREIQITASNRVGFPGQGLRRQISTQFSALKQAVSGPMKIKVVVPVMDRPNRPPTVPASGPSKVFERESDGYVVVEEELEVVEEDEEGSGDEEDSDALVEYLFEQLKEYKTRVSSSCRYLSCQHADHPNSCSKAR